MTHPGPHLRRTFILLAATLALVASQASAQNKPAKCVDATTAAGRPARPELLTPPKFIGGPKPDYPPKLLAAKKPLAIQMEVLVWCDGKVVTNRSRVLSVTDTSMIRPVVSALLLSRFQPGVMNGKPAAATVVVTYRHRPN